MPKDKEGKKLTWKEFFKRWGKGIQGITPLQQTKTNMWSMFPIFAGIIWGMVVTWIGGTWWLFLILFGALPIQVITLIALMQRYVILKKSDEMMKSLEKNKRMGGNSYVG